MRALAANRGENGDKRRELIVGDLVSTRTAHEGTRAGSQARTSPPSSSTALHDAQLQAGAEQGTDLGPGWELRIGRPVTFRADLVY